MASIANLPMLAEFPRWLATTCLGSDEARRDARWMGVTALAREASGETTEGLLRLALRSRQEPSAAVVQKIREAFYATDNTFEMQGNDKELQVLAGATLAASMALTDHGAARSAVAVATAMFGGNRKPAIPIDLNLLADAAIDRIAETNRKRPSLSAFKVTEIPKVDFDAAAAKAREGNYEHVGTAFGIAADATRDALAIVARQQADAVSDLDMFLRIQDEELQMLWWLTGARSLDLDRRFDEIGPNLQPLVFAKELAELTQYLPGPRSVRALLSRAGLTDRHRLAIVDVIDAPGDAGWLKTFMPENEPSPVTMPIHYGIKRQLETGAGGAWVAGWAAAAELPAAVALSPLDLAMLFYRERLLIRLREE